MQLQLRWMLGIVAASAVVFASIVTANRHWSNGIELFGYLTFAISFIVAFHTRSTVIAAYSVCFMASKLAFERQGGYLFGWIAHYLVADDNFAGQLVLDHYFVIFGGLSGMSITYLTLHWLGGRDASANNQ